jgi:hypothetical protein
MSGTVGPASIRALTNSALMVSPFSCLRLLIAPRKRAQTQQPIDGLDDKTKWASLSADRTQVARGYVLGDSDFAGNFDCLLRAKPDHPTPRIQKARTRLRLTTCLVTMVGFIITKPMYGCSKCFVAVGF